MAGHLRPYSDFIIFLLKCAKLEKKSISHDVVILASEPDAMLMHQV